MSTINRIYDAAGNTTSYTGVSFVYNQRGRMSSVTTPGGTTNYIYDALGQLIEKSGAGGTTILMYDEAVRCEIRVAQGHCDRAVTEEVANRIQWHADLNQARGEMMPKIVPAELRDPGALEGMRPSRVEARYDVEDTWPLPGLLKPPPEHAHRLVIERNMARLTILGRG